MLSAGGLGRTLGVAPSGRGDFQFLLVLLDVRSAVPVAEFSVEMLDGVGVVVGSVVRDMGGIFWHPIRGLMGFRLGGYMLEVCVVAVQVWHLEGW